MDTQRLAPGKVLPELLSEQLRRSSDFVVLLREDVPEVQSEWMAFEIAEAQKAEGRPFPLNVVVLAEPGLAGLPQASAAISQAFPALHGRPVYSLDFEDPHVFDDLSRRLIAPSADTRQTLASPYPRSPSARGVVGGLIVVMAWVLPSWLLPKEVYYVLQFLLWSSAAFFLFNGLFRRSWRGFYQGLWIEARVRTWECSLFINGEKRESKFALLQERLSTKIRQNYQDLDVVAEFKLSSWGYRSSVFVNERLVAGDGGGNGVG